MNINHNSYRFLYFLMFAITVIGCKKETDPTAIVTPVPNSAFLKVDIGSHAATRNYVYVDNVPITGAGLVFGNVFPITGYYAAVVPGSHSITIKDTLPTATQLPITFMANFEAGKNYTIFTYDTTNAVKYKMITDEITVPADTTARLRFANFTFSSVAVPNFDVFSKRQNINLFTNVAMAEVKGYIPFPSVFNDTLFFRPTGTTINYTTLFGISLTPKRSYTLTLKGRYQTLGTGSLTTIANY